MAGTGLEDRWRQGYENRAPPLSHPLFWPHLTCAQYSQSMFFHPTPSLTNLGQPSASAQ